MKQPAIRLSGQTTPAKLLVIRVSMILNFPLTEFQQLIAT
jgi:hypothetical protein